MQLSHESYRTRWLILVSAWTLAAITLFAQFRLVSDYLDITGQLGLRGQAASNTPLSAAYPAFAADGQVWVRHALALLEGNDIQLRYTSIDNAPFGREVHWNSAWAWTIAGAGKVHQLFTGAALTTSVEKAARWLNPLVLLALSVLFSAWATRRAGVIAGLVVATAMICKDRIFEGFFPSYVDHHGLLTVAAFGTMLGGLFMGGGWWQPAPQGSLAILPESPDVAREGAVFSALCGACGLWVSAASSIPPIAILGGCGLLAVVVQGRHARAQGAVFDPQVWRLWGRVGACASVFFYLLEYFPRHLGIRLEANHPIFALAWLGGAEIIALLSERWLAPREQRWQNLHQFIWPAAAAAIAPLTILIGGTKVFVPSDPFLFALHRDYIQEFLPLWKTLRSVNAASAFQLLGSENLPLLAAIATITYRRRETPIVVWFITFVAILMNLMAWWQSRWLLNATGAQVCLTLVLLACWTATFRAAFRWTIASAAMLILFIPSGVLRYVGSIADIQARRVAPKDAYCALFRDIALTLRNSQPQGEIVLLSSPNASTGIGYYGRFKTIGTLYWENNDGLKAAAGILGARSEAEAAKLIRERGITHIALVSEENFIAQYFMLLHPDAKPEEMRKCFGHQLLLDKSIPQWLQILPYKVPEDLATLNAGAMLFKVNFNQTLDEALYHMALAQIVDGAVDGADQTLQTIIRQSPQNYQPWLRRAELLIARHDWGAAYEHVIKGISLAPVADRPALYANAAGTFYNNQQHGLAVQVYRTALAEKFDPDVACYLAWVLSTSRDDAVRDGKQALQLSQDALRVDPNSATYLMTLAAALAELGDFNQAVSFSDRAVANARIKGEPLLLRKSEERLALLRSGRPIRE